MAFPSASSKTSRRMPISKKKFKEELNKKAAKDICSEYIFDSDVCLFSKYSTLKITGTYDEFRRSIASQMDVNINCLGIVGSAKLGFSTSPTEKKFKDFSRTSDIDLVIAHEKLFSDVWEQFRKAYYASGNQILRQHARDVFRRFVVVSDVEHYESIYLRDVSTMLDEMKRTVKAKHRIPCALNYRIYASWDDAQRYHIRGIEKLREGTENVDE